MNQPNGPFGLTMPNRQFKSPGFYRLLSFASVPREQIAHRTGDSRENGVTGPSSLLGP